MPYDSLAVEACAVHVRDVAQEAQAHEFVLPAGLIVCVAALRERETWQSPAFRSGFSSWQCH
eukprot:2616484-Amphidinium_carterae.1